MKITYSEVQYASTQKSILTGMDGFGIRTHTRDIPQILLEKLKEKNIFFYDAGSKTLAGTFDLIQNPNLVLEYPKTYCFFSQKLENQLFYVFARTVFLGRDYGWYLPAKEENARSGNIYTHAIIFKDNDLVNISHASVLRNLLPLFLPKNYQNNPNNPELRRLLTNTAEEPVLLSPQSLMFSAHAGLPVLNTELKVGVKSIYDALFCNKRIVAILPQNQSLNYLKNLFVLLPQCVTSQLSFQTNYQNYGLDSEYRLLFLNEFYQSDIPVDAGKKFHILDYKKGSFPAIASNDFSQYIEKLFNNRDFSSLKELNTGFDKMLSSVDSDTDFNQVFYAWLYLLTEKRHNYTFDIEKVLLNIRKYDLKPVFKDTIDKKIKDRFKEALINLNHSKIALSLEMLENIDFRGNTATEINQAFSGYYFHQENAGELHKYCTNNQMIYRFIDEEYLRKDPLSFLSNKLPVDDMNFWYAKFCLKTSPDTAQSLIDIAAFEGKISPAITTFLREETGSRYFDFLQERMFFMYCSQDVQYTYFGKDVVAWLESINLQKELEATVEILWNCVEKTPFFHRYFNDLAQIIIKKSNDFDDYLLLLEVYTRLIKEEHEKEGSNKEFDLIFNYVLENYVELKLDDRPTTEYFQTVMRKLSVALDMQKIKFSNAPSYKKNIYEAEFCLAMSRYAVSCLQLKEKKTLLTLNNIDIPKYSDQETVKMMLRFLIPNIPVGAWTNATQIEHLIHFLNNREYDFYKLTYGEQKQNWITYIPSLYLISVPDNNKTTLDFYKAYSTKVWSLCPRLAKKNYIQETTLAKSIALYLLGYKKYDPEGCKKVTEYLRKEITEEDFDMINALKEHGVITTISEVRESITKHMKTIWPWKKS